MISTIVALKHEIRMRNVYIAHSNSQKLVRAFLHTVCRHCRWTVKRARESESALLSHCVYECVSMRAHAHIWLNMGVCTCMCVWVSEFAYACRCEQGKDRFWSEGRKEGMNESRRHYASVCVRACVREMTTPTLEDKCRTKSKVQEIQSRSLSPSLSL